MLLLTATAFAASDVENYVEQAAATSGVPEAVLLALSYEASHWHVDAKGELWPSTGLFGLRSDGRSPSLEDGAGLLGVATHLIETSPALQTRAVAAMLRSSWDLANPGLDPHESVLLDWWGPVVSFSGAPSPIQGDRYATYVFDLIERGVKQGAITLAPQPVGHSPLTPPPAVGECDYADCDAYYPACSANYTTANRGPGDIDTIVIHTIQGSYSGAIYWFADCDASVSAHYVVRSSDGEVTQTLAEAHMGWHAGDSLTNTRSVGIEHEGYVEYPDDYYTEAMYASSARLVADIAQRNNIPIDRDHIIGHHEVPGCTSGEGGGRSCHTDPGDGWDWEYFFSLLPEADPTAVVRGFVAHADIYNGDRLPGIAVTLQETGELQITDDEGAFYFDDLLLQSYTVTAEAEGYLPSSCTVDTLAGDNWCSLALDPQDEPEDPETGEPPRDTAEPPSLVVNTAQPAPKGCGCNTAAPLWNLGWIALLALARRSNESGVTKGLQR